MSGGQASTTGDNRRQLNGRAPRDRTAHGLGVAGSKRRGLRASARAAVAESRRSTVERTGAPSQFPAAYEIRAAASTHESRSVLTTRSYCVGNSFLTPWKRFRSSALAASE